MRQYDSAITVMMIDDDPLDRMLVKQAFAKADRSVEFMSCESGSDALAALVRRMDRGALPQGCLLDLNMPGQSGIEVLQTMKADPRFRQIPVIMFSSSDRDEDVIASYASQAAGYIRKPEQHRVLEDIISNLACLWAQHTSFAPSPRSGLAH